MKMDAVITTVNRVRSALSGSRAERVLDRVTSLSHGLTPASKQTSSTCDQTTVAADVWEGHEDEEYRRDQSHWRGHGRWKDTARWAGIGQATVKELELAASYVGSAELLDGGATILEWGPGGGTNLHALSSRAKQLVAVDISAKNLEESGRVLAEEGFDRFLPIHLTAEPSSIHDVLPPSIDVFVSTAVFQHFPSKEYGREVLEVVSAHMRPGGIGYVQIRYDNGTRKYAPKTLAEYKAKHITATSYRLDEFWDLLDSVGLQPLLIRNLRTANNYARYLFRRSPDK